MHEKCGTREASPDNRNIRIVEVRIIDVRLYSRLRNKRARCQANFIRVHFCLSVRMMVMKSTSARLMMNNSNDPRYIRYIQISVA